MHDQAGRLVDDEQGVVLEDDAQRDVPAPRTCIVGACDAFASTTSDSPPASLCRGVVTTAPSTPTRPASIQRLQPGARMLRQQLRERLVEAAAGRRRRDGSLCARSDPAGCRRRHGARRYNSRLEDTSHATLVHVWLCCVVRALLAAALFALAVAGCGLFPEVKDETASWSADRLYQTAHEAMMQGNYTRATKLFDQLEARFPYGRYAQQAILESAFANWRANEHGGGDRRLPTASSARIPIIRTSTTRTT